VLMQLKKITLEIAFQIYVFLDEVVLEAAFRIYLLFDETFNAVFQRVQPKQR
jgi:hypothetical protein